MKYIVTGGKHHLKNGADIADVIVLRPGEIVGPGEPEAMTQALADDLNRRLPDRFVPYTPPPASGEATEEAE